MKGKSGKSIMGEKYALLVAVEEYHDSPRIPRVSYAENDANEFAAAILDAGFPAANIEIILNASATKNRIDHALRTLCRRLRPDDELLVFYAGHGFAENGHNFITCHDTVFSDLPGTSIRLQSLLSEIQKCKRCKATIFLDCCQSGFEIDESMRGLLTEEMTDDEFVSFCRESEYHIVFASCRIDERSYSSAALKHGIWSHHVIKAYRGEEPRALERKQFLTASSLQDYLSAEVPQTLRRTFTDPLVQNPHIWGDMSRKFILADLGNVIARRKAASQSSIGNLKRASFRGFVCGAVNSLKGFKKRYHKIPDNVSNATRGFVHDVGAEDLQDVAEPLHGKINKYFNYRRLDVKIRRSDGIVTIITPPFTVHITLDIDEDNPIRYKIAVEVTDIQDLAVLETEEFAAVFDGVFDRIVLDVSGTIPVTKIIDAVEALGVPELISVDGTLDADQCTVYAKELDGELIFDASGITIKMDRKVELAVLLGESRKLPQLLQQGDISGLLPASEKK